MAKKVIVVTGATGTQGSSVARVLLQTGKWHVRAVTRNPDGEKAKALAVEGAEVVYAEYDDEESVRRAFTGAHAIFAVTNWWEYLRRGCSQTEAGDIEERQGVTLARVAAEVETLEHYIWSTLPAADQLTAGSCPVPHFDYKARVDRHIRDHMPALAAKTTFLFFGFYPSNFAFFPMLKPLEVPATRGKYIWLVASKSSANLPISGDMSKAPGVWVRQILANPQITHGKYAAVCIEVITLEQALSQWEEVSGKSAVFVQISPADFEKLYGLPGQEACMQQAFGEAVSDWYAHVREKGLFVTKEQLGVSTDEVADFRGSLELVKEHLG
ncbi:NAD(P)-binding protein [Botryosphaeria dothidea]|uniref:NAD(P)-binding protein n=1 Tax=Botryosphaeria dothidea TaxID=55169 RepID=A0A8H4IK48_9PEZI|nr:NAD(P)-binding protein [Botryosphaeria dothidea]